MAKPKNAGPAPGAAPPAPGPHGKVQSGIPAPAAGSGAQAAAGAPLFSDGLQRDQNGNVIPWMDPNTQTAVDHSQSNELIGQGGIDNQLAAANLDYTGQGDVGIYKKDGNGNIVLDANGKPVLDTEAQSYTDPSGAFHDISGGYEHLKNPYNRQAMLAQALTQGQKALTYGAWSSGHGLDGSTVEHQQNFAFDAGRQTQDLAREFESLKQGLASQRQGLHTQGISERDQLIAGMKERPAMGITADQAKVANPDKYRPGDAVMTPTGSYVKQADGTWKPMSAEDKGGLATASSSQPAPAPAAPAAKPAPKPKPAPKNTGGAQAPARRR